MINTGAIMRTSIDDLSERISIIYYAHSRNERGDIIDGQQTTRCTVWAKVLPVASSIENAGIERTATVTYRIIIRYRNDILPDDKIVWRGKTLEQIATPYDAESRKIWLVLECRDVVKDGKS